MTNIINDKVKDIIFAFLLFLSTVYKVPNYILIVALIYGFVAYGFNRRDFFKFIGKSNFIILTIIYILIVLNFYVYVPDINFIDKKPIPFLSIYIVVFIVAFWMNKKILKYLFSFLYLHVIFAIFEKFIGVNTVLMFHNEFRTHLWDVPLYSSRVFGLSSGINSCGLVLLSTLLMLLYLKSDIPKKLFSVLLILLLAAIEVNFSRSVVISVAFLLFFNFIHKQIEIKYILLLPAAFIFTYFYYNEIVDIYKLYVFNRDEVSIIKIIAKTIVFSSYALIFMYIVALVLELVGIKRVILITFLYISSYYIIGSFGGNIFGSFSGNSVGRSAKDVMSYRDIIYKESFNTLTQRPIRANFSRKLYIYLEEYKVYEHSHNSYLVILSSEGLIISLLIILFIVKNINKLNWMYVVPILITGLFQYSIFWGVSYLDIILIFFLLHVKPIEDKNIKKEL